MNPTLRTLAVILIGATVFAWDGSSRPASVRAGDIPMKGKTNELAKHYRNIWFLVKWDEKWEVERAEVDSSLDRTMLFLGDGYWRAHALGGVNDLAAKVSIAFLGKIDGKRQWIEFSEVPVKQGEVVDLVKLHAEHKLYTRQFAADDSTQLHTELWLSYKVSRNDITEILFDPKDALHAGSGPTHYQLFRVTDGLWMLRVEVAFTQIPKEITGRLTLTFSDGSQSEIKDAMLTKRAALEGP